MTDAAWYVAQREDPSLACVTCWKMAQSTVPNKLILSPRMFKLLLKQCNKLELSNRVLKCNDRGSPVYQLVLPQWYCVQGVHNEGGHLGLGRFL